MVFAAALSVPSSCLEFRQLHPALSSRLPTFAVDLVSEGGRSREGGDGILELSGEERLEA